MSNQNVTATRMTLLHLKNQTAVAQRGHKLLKDKQDGLMQEFLKIIHRAKALRLEIQTNLQSAQSAFLHTQTVLPKAFLRNILLTSYQKLELSVQTKNVMSVKIPKFKLETTGSPYGYGLAQTRGELDITIVLFFKVFKQLIELAEIESSAENLAVEIEKTRRRVNALEHQLIPDLQKSLKLVKMKLVENERSSIVQVMIVKNMIEKAEKEALAKLQKTKTESTIANI